MRTDLLLCGIFLLQQASSHEQHEEVSDFGFAEAAQGAEAGVRSGRWVPYGEPYQEQLVSMLPGSSGPLPGAWSAPMAMANPQPVYMNQQPQIQVVPVPFPTNPEKSEQNSKDLDVGVYTGMDIPWTHIPPFSTTYKAGMGARPPQQPLLQMPFVPNGVPAPPPYAAPSFPSPLLMDPYFAGPQALDPWRTRVPPYPYAMRQQGGFLVKKDDNDVKLTMHVPRDGPPGGVLVMEMKANVYRPVY